ncbi:DUF3347 domain-containing protein [Flavobacterium sp.]|uniref:DUF3347 domain-containing protein n=1 Tax=Flavobacterium sp. TaxID=239 RepID=UPI0037505B6D
MKNVILSILALTFISVSCNKNKQSETTDSATTKPETTTEVVNQSPFSIKEIVSNYLSLKNALTKDDANGAANAGNAIVAVMAKIDMKNLSSDQMKKYMEVADDAKEHAEHIGSNSGDIEHQREHFVLLSKDINDLIITFGTNQKLYLDFCPMADDGKGAIWISETKEIKNPFQGAKMPSCGSVKKEL